MPPPSRNPSPALRPTSRSMLSPSFAGGVDYALVERPYPFVLHAAFSKVEEPLLDVLPVQRRLEKDTHRDLLTIYSGALIPCISLVGRASPRGGFLVRETL